MRLVLTLILAFAGVVHASDNSVDVTLEDTPNPQQSTPPSSPRWRFRPGPANQDSDSQGGQWRYKFFTGSDKPLGTVNDAAIIKALVPASMPITIRWISGSVVVVAADCYSDAHSAGRTRCLYVLEKVGSKWKVTHHYSHGIPTV